MTNDRDPKPENTPKPREWQPPGADRPPYRRGDYEAARRRRERRGVR